MCAAERELTALFRVLRHFNLCSEFQDMFLSVYFGSNPFLLLNYLCLFSDFVAISSLSWWEIDSMTRGLNFSYLIQFGFNIHSTNRQLSCP